MLIFFSDFFPRFKRWLRTLVSRLLALFGRNAVQAIQAVDVEAPASTEIQEVFGRVHSVESMSAVDGPGLRYLVFLQGCPRKCVFCANPDTWDIKGGKTTSSKEILKQIKKCVPYLQKNGGGLTLSGGEPLMQPEYCTALFKEAQNLGLTTCLDTTGYGTRSYWDQVLPVTDLVLLCLKSTDDKEYQELTKSSPRSAKRFLEELGRREIGFYIRYVLMTGHTDNETEAENLIAICKKYPKSCKGIELLPYHRLGVEKWRRLFGEYPLDGMVPPPKEVIDRVVAQFTKAGVPVLLSA